jgi:hypothetical protein
MIAGVMLLLGLSLIAHPIYLWPHYGQTGVGVATEELSETPETYVVLEDLPPEARDALRGTFVGDSQRLWTGEDDRAIDALEETVVRFQGSYYAVALLYGHDNAFIRILLRWLLTAASGFLLVFSVLVLVKGSWRPFTTLRAVWVPVVVTLAFLGTSYYDVTVSGVEGPVLSLTHGLPGPDLIELIPITTLFVAVGSIAARHGWRSRLGLVFLLYILLLVIARFVPTEPVSLAALLGYTAIGGVPWLGLGFLLTR